VRIDKLLWYLRLARSRTVAQEMAEQGHIRANGRRVERAHHKVAAGDVLTVPVGREVRVIELLALPVRRGPASEAQSLYRLVNARLLDASADVPIAAAAIDTLQEGSSPP
jgi:ribosome-associated heat shock protein Hsp15